MFFPRLLPQRTLLDFGAEGGQFVGEKLPHAHDIWAALVFGRDGRDGDGFAETLDEVVGQGVDLLEEPIELRRHLLCLVCADCVR